MKHASLLVLLVLASASCSDAPRGQDAPPLGSPTSTPPPSLTREDVEAALSSCDAERGTTEPYDGVEGLVSLLAGPWLYCSSTQDRLKDRDDVERLGYEFTPDGHVFFLSRDEVSGGVVRGRGIAGPAVYEILPPSDAKVNNVGLQINVRRPDRFTMPTRATFEKGPRRLFLQGFDGAFVPIVGRAR